MAGRERTTKKLAQRIDRNYFKRTFAIARWRRLLTAAFVLLGLVWIAWHALRRDEAVYSSGPLTRPHAYLNHQCNACHAATGPMTLRISNQACTNCHDGALHNPRQTFAPSCAGCHQEHKGPAQLRLASERSCTICHANLKVKTGTLKVAASISSFRNHPQFEVVRGGRPDPGTIKFSHAVHLRPSLRGTQGNVQLQCLDCHQNTGTGPESMQPVNYHKHCAPCHTLSFFARIADAAPHQAPDIVERAVVQKLQAYITAHPSEIGAVNEAQIARVPLRPPARDAAEWVRFRTAEAEHLLWDIRCAECHAVSRPSGAALPVVADSKITARWMPHASFRHTAHAMLNCESCHTTARHSEHHADVLLPGIEICQKCHASAKAQSASASCNECHQYHDRTRQSPKEGHYTIEQLVSRK